MKIAILLCGHIRTWEKCKNSFLNTFPKDVDVFMHTYSSQYHYHPYIQNQIQLDNEINNKILIDIKELVNLPNLKRIVIEKEIDEIDMKEYPINFDIYSQLRKVDLCNELRKEWENEHGFKYDVVIKTRFDIYYEDKFNLNSLSKNNIYYLISGGILNSNDVCYYGLAEDFDKLIKELRKKYSEKIINPHTWMDICINNLDFKLNPIPFNCYVKRFST
jgi:hypothetical protein